MRTASDFVGGSTSGNTTEIDIAAPPAVVWRALEDVRLGDLRATAVLMGDSITAGAGVRSRGAALWAGAP